MSDNFAHHLRLDQIRDGDRVDLVADEAERSAIARRLALPSLARLDAHATLSRTGDTIRAHGRFAVLATVTAITLARLERDGERGQAASIALTERFIEVMESEHRELGLGDPTLGKTVRKLVGMLGRRTDRWRDPPDLREATRQSLYKDDVSGAALAHSTDSLRTLRERIAATPLDRLVRGDIG